MLDFTALREPAKDWDNLKYKPVDDGQDWYDDNADNRHQVCLALQYDRRTDDLELVRFIFEQEILRAENDPQQGGGDDLGLCAFLLAKEKDPKDFSLFIRAKTANFDTACGFSGECLFYLGIEETQPHIQESDRDLFAGYDFTQEDIDRWFAHCHNYFPEDWNAASLLSRCDELRSVGLTEQAKVCLEAWESEMEPTKRNLNGVRMRWKLLGELERAAAAQDRIDELEA